MEKMYTNLLILLLAFEKQWLKYFFSEGFQEYRDPVKQSAKVFINYLYEVYEKDPSVFNSKSLGWNKDDSEDTIRIIVESLHDWARSNDKTKYPKFFYDNVKTKEQGLHILNLFFGYLELYLSDRSGLDKKPILSIKMKDVELHENYIKWTQHLSYRVIDLIDDKFLKNISSYDTIVVVADIRNSQDLITYSPNRSIYRKNIMKIVNTARQLVTDNFGIFDRFTGDGFICYFNKYICSHFDREYLSTALKVCNSIMQYSEEVFQDWVKHIRKLPSTPIGLSIGMDSGNISFSEVDNHFFAIGVPCVWATRACDAGNAGDIVLNNIIMHQYSNIFKDSGVSEIEIEEKSSSTKTGESYKVYAVKNDWRSKHL